ncbi:hypothetical protein H8959_013558 [Pygathrix nigripes]
MKYGLPGAESLTETVRKESASEPGSLPASLPIASNTAGEHRRRPGREPAPGISSSSLRAARRRRRRRPGRGWARAPVRGLLASAGKRRAPSRRRRAAPVTTAGRGASGRLARRGQREAGLACGRRKEAEEEEEEEAAAAGSRGRGAGGGPGEGRSGICGAPRRCREPAGPRVTGVTAAAGGAAASDPPPGGAQPRPGPAPFPPRAASPPPPPPPPRERSLAHPAPAAEPGSRVGVGRPARVAPGPRGGHCSRSPGGAAPPPSELGCPDMKVRGAPAPTRTARASAYPARARRGRGRPGSGGDFGGARAGPEAVDPGASERGRRAAAPLPPRPRPLAGPGAGGGAARAAGGFALSWGGGGGEAAGPVTGGSSALGTDTGRRGPPGRFRSRGPQRGLALPSPRKSPVWSQSRAAGGSRRQKSRPGTRQARPVAGRDGECPRLRATAGLAGRLCGQGTGSPRRLEPAPASRLGLGASLGSGNQVPGVDPTPPQQANSLLSHPGGAGLAPRRPRCPRRHVLPTRQGFGKRGW